ncbi:hypothetical protein [Synechocystis sp. PCC 6714]|uniref:hypothetical protein n=1 Tax=Synechocystis sp. (strain PCC 6714) TaxID=1147 RepID=UPI000589D94E|nr:hypothetical protein [Synechocystis sp. PCC 6714]
MPNQYLVSERHKYDDDKEEIIYINEGGRREIYGNISGKINIYEARVVDWFFDIARQLTPNDSNTGDYVALMIALSYVEGVEQFRRGNKVVKDLIKNPNSFPKSDKLCKNSLRRIFPGYPDEAKETSVYCKIYKQIRCGLFHSGFTRKKIYLSYEQDKAIQIKEEVTNIHPKLFLECIISDFEKYILALKDPNENQLRENFEKLWDYLWEES